MKKSFTFLMMGTFLLTVCSIGRAATYTWDFSTEADYWLYNATWSSGKATVPAIYEDEASVFARVNTQAYHLLLDTIAGGGYKVTNLNNPPGTIYGSLYLSPTGGSGSTVLILLSPMSWTGGSGNYNYTFDRNTHADYRTRVPPGDWSAYDPARSGTFAEVVEMLRAGGNTDYVAFFGPQIGMSGTHNTSFEVTEITLSTNPITVSVYASSAPNAYGSPSWNGYMAKALSALENGLPTNGDRSTDPTAYETAPAMVGAGEIAVASFNSWRGILPGGFAGEYGNRMHFGLHAIGDGTQQFILEDLTFELHSSDPGDSLIYTGDFIGLSYNGTSRYGIDWGDDRAKGGGDDTKYTSGNGTTLVDEIVYVGVGNAWWPSPSGGQTNQDAMDEYFDWVASEDPIAVTCTYDILGYTGSDSVAIVKDTNNILKLDVDAASIYVKPGENVITDMDVMNLLQKVNSCQAMLGYSSTYLQASAGCVVAGGGVWDELIYNSWDVGSGIPGEIDTAIGIDAGSSTTGTDADGTVAVITLKALTAGVTKVVFRPDVVGDETKQTFLSDMSSQIVWPGSELDSQTIVIDGTNPVVMVTYPNGGENLKGGSSCTITWTATDSYIDADSVKLEYYNGSAWVEIASDEDNDGSYDWTVPSLDISTAKVRVSVSDLAGNTGSDESDAAFTIDSTNPVVGTISATQFGGPELTPSGSGNAVQGVVNIAVATSDNLSGVAGAPTVTVVDSALAAMVVTYVNESPANTFNYTVTVLSTTANGAATITVSGFTDNAGNVAGSSNDTFDINKNQITGSVALQAFVGASRAVTFVATGGASSKTWTQTLSFSGGVASFTLTDVPAGSTSLSAKTNWSLRSKVALGGGTDNQWTADLTGSYKLLGGDLNGSNAVNILDYSVFKVNYGTSNPVADITGDGSVNSTDYFYLRLNFFTAGDAE